MDFTRRARTAIKVGIVVIGAGQAGLSSAYHLRRLGLEPNKDFVIFDAAKAAGGAWQFRWPSLTLAATNRVHDLPGLKLEDVVDVDASGRVPASTAVPRYFEAYKKTFELPVHRPVDVKVVCDRGDRLRVETDAGSVFRPRHHQRDRHLGNALHPRLSRPRPLQGQAAPTPGTITPPKNSQANT